MNCPWLERVALAMDGEWTSAVEAHVRECGECSGLLEDRELLQSAPELPRVVPVRTPRPRLTWWPAAIAAAAAAVVLGWTLQPSAVDPMPGVTVHHPAAPAVEARHVAAVPKPIRRPPGPQPAPPRFDADRLAGTLASSLRRPSAPSDAVTVYTDDPEVVIMLLPSKGDSEDD